MFVFARMSFSELLFIISVDSPPNRLEVPRWSVAFQPRRSFSGVAVA